MVWEYLEKEDFVFYEAKNAGVALATASIFNDEKRKINLYKRPKPLCFGYKLSIRAKLSGLTRIQKSVFAGQLTERVHVELEKDLPKYLSAQSDRIYLTAIDKRQFEEMSIFGQGFSKRRVSGKALVLFF